MTQIQYLGYIVGEHGVHVDPAKIQIIWDWPAPTTLTELRSFLSLANFSQDSCWDFLILLGPEPSDQGWWQGQICMDGVTTESI